MTNNMTFHPTINRQPPSVTNLTNLVPTSIYDISAGLLHFHSLEFKSTRSDSLSLEFKLISICHRVRFHGRLLISLHDYHTRHVFVLCHSARRLGHVMPV